MALSTGTLHEYGYTFHGDAPVGGLTPTEAELLVLDRLIRNEEQEDRADEGARKVPHSKSRRSTRRLARQRAQEKRN